MNIKKSINIKNEITVFNTIYFELLKRDIDEPFEVFVPFHNLFWARNTNYTHYLNYLTGWWSPKQNMDDLLSMSPFKIIKLYFSRENDECDRIKIRCDENIDLIKFFHYVFIPSSLYGIEEMVEERISHLLESFNITPSKNNEFVIQLSEYQLKQIKDYVAKNLPIQTPLGNIFHSSITFFNTYEDALLNCIHECYKKVSTTVSFIRNCNKRFINQSFERNKTVKLQFLGNMYQTEKDKKDMALLRKLMLRGVTEATIIRDDFKNNIKILTDLNDPEKIDLLFDYNRWNNLMNEFTKFHIVNDKEDRRDYFNQKLIKKRINDLKRRTRECAIKEK